MSKLSVVVGGAFGSEAKGAVTARLTRMSEARSKIVVRTAGHNAGHTAYDDRGHAWALRTVPVGMVADLDAVGVIAAGSEVNPDVLAAEVTELEAAGIPIRDRLYVDVSATWLDEGHIEAEVGMHEKSGSTGKGVGAARAARVMRTARTIGEWDELSRWCVASRDTGQLLRAVASRDTHVILEGTQGYGLGVHTDFYPLTTSSDCRAIDFLAMAGIDPTAFDEYEVWVVLRRFPIRVAGPSGPLRGETTWGDLGLPEERTTVTKKVRRVGEWDADLAAEAVEANGGGRVVRVAYTMLDQDPDFSWIAGADCRFYELGHARREQLLDHVRGVDREIGANVGLVGTGPNSMVEL